MHHLSIDIETYSSVDLKKSGLYKYAQSPDFEILLFAYSFDGTPVKIVDLKCGEKIPSEILTALYDRRVIKHAYNAAFEWYCLCQHIHHETLLKWLEQWQCTMLHGLYCGYTAGLEKTAEALGLPPDKHKKRTGTSLINTFSKPVRPTKTNGQRTRTLPKHEPEKWELFKDYCKQDVVVEMEVESRLSKFPVPQAEQIIWQLDQSINEYGVRVDEDLIKSALYIDKSITSELKSEAKKLTGLDNPNSVPQLTPWLEEKLGQAIPDLQKATVSELLSGDIPDDARRMLEIRRELSKTSNKKYTAMKDARCDDGRVRGLLQFYGANRTGRWAGRLVQVQNLPRNYLGTLDLARQAVKDRKFNTLKLLYGNVPDTLSQLIRTAFVPNDGYTFVVADFSAIEARVIAWLAGEQWRLEVFATHGKIYEASASAMFGVPIEKIVKGNQEYALRQKGKIAELALGYQGAKGALVTMGALNMGLTEEELPEIVSRWRESNKRIVDFWYTVENAAITAMKEGQAGVNNILFTREGDLEYGHDFLTVRLPSGRKLYYAKPFLAPNQWGRDSLHYYGMDQQTKKWVSLETYGGKLVENIVQAIARDCLVESLVRLKAAGYKTVMHVHDEAILEVPKRTADLDKVCAIMGQPISWAPRLLLKADGFITDYYKKD